MMDDVDKRSQHDQEINAYLAFYSDSSPSLGGPINPDDVSRDILDAISKKVRNLVEVVSSYGNDGYKRALIQIYNTLIGNKVEVRLLKSLSSFLEMPNSSYPVVYILSEDHFDIKGTATARVMRKILSGNVETIGNKGILVLGITHGTIERFIKTAHNNVGSRKNSDDEYTPAKPKATGLGLILFSLPLLATLIGMFDATGYSEAYSPYIMGFWASTSLLAIFFLVFGFIPINEDAGKITILSCSVFLAINLIFLAILGPSALEIKVPEYGLYPVYLSSETVAFRLLLENVLLQLPNIILSLTIIYRLLPVNLRKFSMIAFFCGLSSIIIEAVALDVYLRQIVLFSGNIDHALFAIQTYLSFFSFNVFIHPTLSLEATVYALNFFKIYISIPVIGFAIIYNVLNFFLYARLGIEMLSLRKEPDMP